MLPIASYPSVVEDFLPKVKNGFSKPQLKQFTRYLTGLIVCDNKTVTAINNSFVGHNDQSALNNWLTDSDWSEEKLDHARKQLIKEELNAKNNKNGVLIIDDTLNHKTGKHMDGVDIHFDHAQGKTALGHQLVTSHLACGKYSLPLGFELYQRNEDQADFKSKNELAQVLISKAFADGFCFDCVVMDVWYFNFENTSYIESLAKDWVSGCKINRIIQTGEGYVSLFDYLQTLPKEEFKKVSVKTTKGERCFWTFAKNVSLKKHNQRVRVVFSYLDEKLTGEPKVLVTKRLNWDIKTILETYLLRWKIDAFYRDAKQELGLDELRGEETTGSKTPLAYGVSRRYAPSTQR